MIYLFNSAFRPLYTLDVLNVLALPEGCTALHRYRVSGGDYRHVHPGLAAGIRGEGGVKRIRRGEDPLVRAFSGLEWGLLPAPKASEVLFLFVDREGSYTYYPLRRGTLYEAWERDDRLYFRVQLDDFLAAQPEQVRTVSDRIKLTLNESGPTAPADSRGVTSDGCYALCGADAVSEHPDVLTGEDAWNAAVDCLSRTTKFASTDQRRVVFVRTSVERRGRRRPERALLSGVFERIPIRKNAAYELRLSYRSVAEQPEPPGAKIAVDPGESLQVLNAGALLVQASADDLVVPMVAKRYADDHYSYISVSVQPLPRVKRTKILGPSVDLLIGIREPRAFWLKVVGLLSVFVLSTLVLDVKPTEIKPTWATLPDLGAALFEQVTPWRLVAAAAQASVLFILFRLIGKKPV